MGITETAKTVRDLVGKLDNFDLLQKAVDLQAQVADLVTENIELREKIRALEDRQKIQGELRFDSARGCYYRGKDGPYCQICFDVDSRLVWMAEDKHSFFCRFCLRHRNEVTKQT